MAVKADRPQRPRGLFLALGKPRAIDPCAVNRELRGTTARRSGPEHRDGDFFGLLGQQQLQALAQRRLPLEHRS